MILHAFYNLENIGDILLVRLCDERRVTRYELDGDLCVLYHNDSVIGYNLMRASHYISHLDKYQVIIDETFVDELNSVLRVHQMDEVVSDYDSHIKVGHVIAIEDHPDSDHMHICQIDIGDEVLQIVCGAPNIALNQYVVVALDQAVMPNGLVIKPSKLRGVQSNGMICSARELNLANAPLKRGILVLDPQQYHIGDTFYK